MFKRANMGCMTALLALSLLASAVGAGADASASKDFTSLPADIVDIFAALPLQDGGRVKPLDTVARFKLLRIHGKRTLRLGEGRGATKLSATEWMVQALLFPARVVDMPLFVVDNAEVVVAIGVNAHAKKRSRFSYKEIYKARDKLSELAQQYSAIEPKSRSAYQNGIVNLGQNVSEFEYLMHTLDYARERFSLSADALPGVVEADVEMRVVDFLQLLPKVRESLQQSAESGDEAIAATESITKIVRRLSYMVGAGSGLHTMPPEDVSETEWLSPGDLINQSLQVAQMSPAVYAHLSGLSTLVEAGDDMAALKAAAQALSQSVRAGAQTRGEMQHLDLEVRLYKGNYFFWSLFWFLAAFIVVASSWLKAPNANASRAARLTGLWVKLTPLMIATAYLVIGITLRCIIRGRPPVTNLYETVLFITAVTVLVAMMVEWIVRDRIAIALAPVLGAMGMFLANKYELKEAVDTMPSLVAVLNTNFWLSTHVTCITIGYAAGLLAGALGHLYVFGKILGIKKSDEGVYASIGRMTYGVLCFGLLFAFVGTMLGGIWANYSWGRFWGWDPKENGALMIVLWLLVILHARMGHYIRDFGVAVCSIFGAAIVTFSWWGVNLLGVGLHSYGFTSGIARTLMIYWVSEGVVILLAFAWRLKHKV